MVQILGVPLYDKDIPSAWSLMSNEIEKDHLKENKCISATGAHGLVYAQKNPPFKAILSSFFLNLPDGMPGVWIGRLKGAKEMRRCYGPAFFEHVMKQSATVEVNHFFCGGGEHVAQELERAVARKFSNHRVVGTYTPPFLPVEEFDYKSLGDRINATGTNVVWIGLSTPKQEMFASRLSVHTRVNFIITVGAAFDFHTDRLVRAPRWMQRIGMEWFFRLLAEPRRLYKRYIEVVPAFIYFNIREFYIFATRKKRSS